MSENEDDYDYSQIYDDVEREEDEFDLNEHLKKHSSILGRILVLVVAFFFITVVIDPMTPGINESEMIYESGSYPYDKFMGMFRDEIEDSDDDGLSDKDEERGWERESEVLSLKQGDTTQFKFKLKYPGNYLIETSVKSDGASKLKWGWGAANSTINISNVDWEERTVGENATYLQKGEHYLFLKIAKGNITIDWISVISTAKGYGISLDSTDFHSTNGTVTNMIVHVKTDPNNPDTDYDGMLDGYEAGTGKLSGGWQDPRVTNNRFALLLAGGSTTPQDNFPSIKNNVEYAYKVLHDFYGYKDENIKVLSWDGDVANLDIVDGAGNLENIDSTFDELNNEMGQNDFLFVYLTSHGIPGEIEVYRTPSKHDTFLYRWLEDNLTRIHEDAGVKNMAVIVEACNSGSVLFDLKEDFLVTIASTEADNPSYASNNVHALFTHFFFEALNHPNLASIPSYENVKNVDFTFEEHKFISLGEAYDVAKSKLKVQELSGREQNPLMDQNGDGIADDKKEGKAYSTYI